MQGAVGAARRVLAPDQPHQRVGRDVAAEPEGQRGQDRARLAGADVHGGCRIVAERHLARSEHADPHAQQRSGKAAQVALESRLKSRGRSCSHHQPRRAMKHTETTPSYRPQLTLPGQAHTAEGPHDQTGMYVMHHALRRDFDRFAAAVEGTPIAEHEVWAALERALGRDGRRAAPPPLRRGRRAVAAAAAARGGRRRRGRPPGARRHGGRARRHRPRARERARRLRLDERAPVHRPPQRAGDPARRRPRAPAVAPGPRGAARPPDAAAEPERGGERRLREGGRRSATRCARSRSSSRGRWTACRPTPASACSSPPHPATACSCGSSDAATSASNASPSASPERTPT